MEGLKALVSMIQYFDSILFVYMSKTYKRTWSKKQYTDRRYSTVK